MPKKQLISVLRKNCGQSVNCLRKYRVRNCRHYSRYNLGAVSSQAARGEIRCIAKAAGNASDPVNGIGAHDAGLVENARNRSQRYTGLSRYVFHSQNWGIVHARILTFNCCSNCNPSQAPVPRLDKPPLFS
ncbi:hypothetical protein CHELA1G11_21633 [Hyphomicrobiales bacterium]|nr:hypothetical protein CHELA1G11_21633 [Hyphomicrobiales bacterium]CAH1695292.1 hypothetical protein CHELA1G2_21937 [Hyphomicrobiales bacterium]